MRVIKDHPKDQVIGDIQKGVPIGSSICMLVLIWLLHLNSNQDLFRKTNIGNMPVRRVNQFERNKVLGLFRRPEDHFVIGTKCEDKLDENGVIIRDKARLVAQ